MHRLFEQGFVDLFRRSSASERCSNCAEHTSHCAEETEQAEQKSAGMKTGTGENTVSHYIQNIAFS